MNKQNSMDIKTIKLTLKYFKEFWPFLFIFAIILISENILELLQPFFLSKVVDSISTFVELKKIILYCILIFITSLGNNIILYIESILLTVLTNKMEIKVKRDYLNKYIRYSFMDIDKMENGRLIEEIERDAKVMPLMVIQIVYVMLSDILMVLLLLLLMLKIDITLTVIITLVFPISYYINKKYGGILKKINGEYKRNKDSYLSFTNEIFKGIKTIKNHNAERFFLVKYKDSISKLYLKKFKLAEKSAERNFINNFVNSLCYILMLVIGVLYIRQNIFSLGEFILFSTYATSLTNSFYTLTKLRSKVQVSMVSVERLKNILISETHTSEHIDADIQKSKLTINKIELKDLSYSIDGKEIIKGMNIVFEKGKLYSIVGKSGSGKSTLLNLIRGNILPSSGYVKYLHMSDDDGYYNSIKEHSVLVSQQDDLFTLPIIDNILMSFTNDNQINIVSKCKDLDIWSKISELSKGINTIIDDTKLSVGQKQKIIFCRALNKEYNLFLFDEVTSSLDLESEKKMLMLMKELANYGIVISVSHRYNTAVTGDDIVIIEDGLVKKSGETKKIIKTDEFKQVINQI